MQFSARTLVAALVLVLPGSGLAQEVRPAGPARLFAPGVISTAESDDLHIAFTPDGRTAYFVRRPPGGRFAIHVSHLDDDGVWSPPAVAPFSGRFSDQEPFVSPDGRRLHFTSDRPLEGTEPVGGRNAWVMDASAHGWSEPRRLEAPIRVERPDVDGLGRFWGQARGPVEAADGSLYFWAERPGSLGHTDIYRARRTDDGWSEPQNLGSPISSERYETAAAVAPDGRWIVFGRDEAEDGLGLGDLYLAYRTGSGWTRPRNLGPWVNSAAFDFSPRISADGRYLFFSSNRAVDGAGTGRQNIWYVELR